MQAGNRLDLLAGNDLVNKAGGIIAGRDVSLAAVQDVINERTLTSHQSSNGSYTQQRDFVDTAARVEAANTLAINAGRDLDNNGGVLGSGADTTLQAGRDVKLTSVEQVVVNDRGVRHTDSSVTQNGSSVQVGRDLSVSAGRDISAVASAIEAKRDVVMSATENLNLVSAADETHSASKTKKIKSQEDHVSQVATTVTAGGDVVLASGADLNIVSSRVTAGDEAYLVAGGQLNLLAQQDSDYSLYDMKKKGDWGSKKTQRDEVTQVTHVGSEVSAGGNLTLKSEGDQTYQVAKLESGKDLTLESGGGITFEGVKDLHQESHEKSKGDLAWNSMKGKGSTDETLRQSQLLAQGELTIKAVDGLKVDLKHIDQKTVSQTIDAMVEADPQLAWLKEAEKRGDVDWRRVQEVHDSWKYSHSGLGAGAQIVIAIIVTYLTAGAASGAIAAAGAGTSMAGATVAATATTSAGWLNAAGTAVLSGMAGTGAVSTINNRGNLGNVLKDVTSSDALRGYAVGGVTAGLTAGVFDQWTSTQTGTSTAVPNTGAVTPAAGLGTWQGIGQFTTNQLLQGGTSALVDRALGGEGNLGDAMRSSLANAFAAYGFNLVGDSTAGVMDDGSLGKIGLHALVGGLAAEATGGDFRTGALAAGVNEALVDSLANQYASLSIDDKKGLLVVSSQLIGVLTAAAQGKSDSESLQTAAWVAGSATQYNYLEHSDVLAFAEDMAGCGKDENCQKEKWEKQKYNDESLLNVEEAQNTYGPQRAKEKSLQIADSIGALMSVQCGTTTCESYKTALLERSVDSYAHLSNVLNEWAPTLDRLGLIGGAAAGKQGGSRPVGVPERNGLAQIQKAVDYLGGAKATSIEFLPKATRNSAGQIEAKITQSSAIKTLESNGYKKTISQDGSVTVLTNGEKTYRFYPSSTSTGQPSASLNIEGVKKPTAKIRFPGE